MIAAWAKTTFAFAVATACCECAGVEPSSTTEGTRTEHIRTAIERSIDTPRPQPGMIVDLSAFDLQLADESKYTIAETSDRLRARTHVTRAIIIREGEGATSKRVRVYMLAGHVCVPDLVEYLVGFSRFVSAPITESTYMQRDDGPGDICVVSGAGEREASGEARGNLWFCRGSVLVHIQSGSDADLLPISRAVDDALKACQAVEVAHLTEELPGVTIEDPVRIGEAERTTYRVDFTLLAPLADHQRVVAVSPDPRAQLVIEEGHVLIVLRDGDELPEFSVGVYDSKKAWIKWHDEPASQEGKEEDGRAPDPTRQGA